MSGGGWNFSRQFLGLLKSEYPSAYKNVQAIIIDSAPSSHSSLVGAKVLCGNRNIFLFILAAIYCFIMYAITWKDFFQSTKSWWNFLIEYVSKLRNFLINTSDSTCPTIIYLWN